VPRPASCGLQQDAPGAVPWDGSVCVGCRYCMIACPFEVPTFEYNEPLTPDYEVHHVYPQIMSGQSCAGCVGPAPRRPWSTATRTTDHRRRSAFISTRGRYLDYIYGEHEMGGTTGCTLGGALQGPGMLRTWA